MATIPDHSEPVSGSGSWRRWVEPWYLAFALQGMVIAGMLPILIPLTVSQSGAVAEVGLVMAALNLGGLTSPVWGTLADRFRVHRILLIGGLIISAASLAAFAIAIHPGQWIVLALLAGLGAAGTATVANLFIVEIHAKAEWDERIGWLQTFYGVGQVGGLFLGGLFSQNALKTGLIVSAGLCVVAALFGGLSPKPPKLAQKIKPVLTHPARMGDWAFLAPQRLFHHLDLSTIRKLGPALGSKFGLLLLIWLLAIGGSGAFFSQYPIIMQKVYGLAPPISSTAFAVVAGLGLALYSPSGIWSNKFGANRVMNLALIIRWLAYLLLFSIGFFSFGLKSVLALIGLAFVVCAWSVISVSGTSLAAQLSRVGEGEGMGIFNAVNSLAGVLGAALGGLVAVLWGYNFLTSMAVVGIGLGIILTLGLRVAIVKTGD